MGFNTRKIVALSFLLSVVFLGFADVSNFEVLASDSKTIVVPDDYQTINWAVGNASNGDSIFVKAGIYYEVVVINKSLSLIGEDRETTIIDGRTNGPVVLIRHDDVELSGFTIQNGRSISPASYYDEAHSGIHLLHVNRCNISRNAITNSSYGIWVYDSSGNYIIENNFNNNVEGIRLESSDYNFLLGNYMVNDGISFYSSQNNTLKKNHIYDDGFFRVSTNSLVNDVDISNKMGCDKTIYFLVNQSNKIIPSDAGCVILAYCSGITVQNLTLANNYHGLIVAHTQNSVIKQNNITNHRCGILLHRSSNNCITENTITDCDFSGIDLPYSSNNTICRNNLTRNHWGIQLVRSYHNDIIENNIERSETGIQLFQFCEYNNIIQNRISYNDVGVYFVYTIPNEYRYTTKFTYLFGNIINSNNICGIQLTVTTDNSIIGNTISNNSAGVRLSSLAKNTKFYSNNFLNNTRHLGDSVDGGTTIWNNDFPLGGNFWSAYNLTDNYRGVHQSDSGSDGIGDIAYVPRSGIVDSYPLLAPIAFFDVGTWEWTDYFVSVISNSSVSDLVFSPEGTITFNVTCELDTECFCRVIIPKELLDIEDDWTVFVDDKKTSLTVDDDRINSYIYFIFPSTSKAVKIIGLQAIPEFPLWLFLSLFVVATLVAVFVCKRLATKPCNHI